MTNVYSITFRKPNGQMVKKTVLAADPAAAIQKAAQLVGDGATMVSLTTDAEGAE